MPTVIGRDQVIYGFEPNMMPVATVEPGEEIEFHTRDALNGQVTSEADGLDKVDFDRVNPATGPVEVKGAEPGDALAVEVLSIDLSSQGIQALLPKYGVLEKDLPDAVFKFYRVDAGGVSFPGGLKLALRPMIGLIGVATPDQYISNFYPGDHGGNMDTPQIGPGATVYLPVWQKGAFLGVGDVHARQADGEVCVSAVECEATVRVRVGLAKGADIPGVMVEQGNLLMTIGVDADLRRAVAIATERMIQTIEKRKGLSWEEAYMLLSLAGEARISQVVNPLMTARIEVDISLLGL